MSRSKPDQDPGDDEDEEGAKKELPEIVRFGREVTLEIFRVLEQRMRELGVTNRELMARAGISANRFSKYRYSSNAAMAVHYLVLLSRKGGIGLTVNEMLGRFGDQFSDAGTPVAHDEVEHEQTLRKVIYAGAYPIGPKRALELILLGMQVNDQLRADAEPGSAHAKPPQPIPGEPQVVRRGGRPPGFRPGGGKK